MEVIIKINCSSNCRNNKTLPIAMPEKILATKGFKLFGECPLCKKQIRLTRKSDRIILK